MKRREEAYIELNKMHGDAWQKEHDCLLTATDILVQDHGALSYEYGYYMGKYEVYHDMVAELDKLIESLNTLESEVL